MPKLTLKTTLSALIVTGAMAATPALAQTADDQVPADQTWEVPAADIQIEIDHFAIADVSGDSLLDMDEFKTYVSSKADSGDEASVAVRDAGDYAAAFTAHDIDADGVLSAVEIYGTDEE